MQQGDRILREALVYLVQGFLLRGRELYARHLIQGGDVGQARNDALLSHEYALLEERLQAGGRHLTGLQQLRLGNLSLEIILPVAAGQHHKGEQ